MEQVGPEAPIEVWYSGPESEVAKRVIFNEAVRQGRIMVHWESYHDEALAGVEVRED